MWEAKEQHFKAHFSRHSLQLIGEARQVSWRSGWVSPQGSGVSGFFRPGGPERWDLTNETINGIAKNGGIASALTGDEYSEFTMALQGKKWLSLGGCFDTHGKEAMTQCEFEVAVIESDKWDRLAPRTRRILKTIAMSPEYWSVEEVRAYADLANQGSFAMLVDGQIQRRFDVDCLRIPDIAIKVATTLIW
ncbi:hypothetical protein [Geothrix sp. SG200]|uniref:hypothetical protein n=1 Tax=Geothrix sp. SG200 TaxID=2922865 RepID=UPI001FAD8279|nr:hypothetical protein [Geothrix sp. SG200]